MAWYARGTNYDDRASSDIDTDTNATAHANADIYAHTHAHANDTLSYGMVLHDMIGYALYCVA